MIYVFVAKSFMRESTKRMYMLLFTLLSYGKEKNMQRFMSLVSFTDYATCKEVRLSQPGEEMHVNNARCIQIIHLFWCIF